MSQMDEAAGNVLEKCCFCPTNLLECSGILLSSTFCMNPVSGVLVSAVRRFHEVKPDSVLGEFLTVGLAFLQDGPVIVNSEVKNKGGREDILLKLRTTIFGKTLDTDLYMYTCTVYEIYITIIWMMLKL